MSDFFDAFTGPFISFGDTFKTLFTNPSKLRAVDIPTLLLPIPGVGSTLTYDLQHPEAAGYQGAVIASVAGGDKLLQLYGPASFASPADQAAAQAANSEYAASMHLFDTAPSVPSFVANIPSIASADFLKLTGPGGVPVTPTTPSALTTAAAATKPSLVSSAVSGFLQNVRDAGPIAATLALLKGQKPQTGPGVNGGSNPPTGIQGVPVPVPVGQGSELASVAKSKSSQWLMLGALAGVGYWLYKKSHKH